MNTSQLKSFAQQARLKLMEQVGAKLHYVLNVDSAAIRGKEQELIKLKAELNEIGEQALVEKVAYTWFNRLVAIRFMDANGFQPFNVSIISPVEGSQSSLAEVIELIQGGNIPEELNLDRGLINDLLDGKAVSNNPNNEIMRMVLVEACNYYHSLFPFLFEKINDYTELLLPDDLVSPISILADVVKGMLKEDCAEVEIIGWLYQFYISEKKDEVFAGTGRVKKEDIPAATQLFTPRWIVEYMVQNTVGKLWLLNKPNSSLKDFMPYYIETENTDDYLHINSVEEIKLLDQACGSGHILVYGFELLAKIYEEEGYSSSEIPAKIIENNLHGFEIDERASQLASFAIVMKARQYYRRFFRKVAEPKIVCYIDTRFTEDEIATIIDKYNVNDQNVLSYDLKLLDQATNLGSLMQPYSTLQVLEAILAQLQAEGETSDLFWYPTQEKLKLALKQLIPLAHKYHCVVDNPPYMGGGNMNNELSNYVKKNYPKSKADLMACFMEAGLAALVDKGYLGMINQHSWMFLSSYEQLRKHLIETIHIDTLLHLGPRTFPEIGGEVVQNAAFTFVNHISYSKGKYLRLLNYGSSELKRNKLINILEQDNSDSIIISDQNNFNKIPCSRLGYWVNENNFHLFSNKKVRTISVPQTGLQTSDNTRFLREWFEIKIQNLNFSCKSVFDTTHRQYKWYPYNKGGNYKWAGDRYAVINWGNNGFEIKQFNAYLNSIRSSSIGIGSIEYFFKSGITTKKIGGNFSARFVPEGFIFDSGGPLFFSDNDKYLLGFFNSTVIKFFLSIYNPTLNFQVGDISDVPIIISNEDVINKIVQNLINISLVEWNSRETSWDFTKNELVRLSSEKLSSSIESYKAYWKEQFYKLHQNEEELNSQFIEIYGLQDELTTDVPLEDITILKDETEIVNGELVFKEKELIVQFISYAVGCVFGRYFLDKEGLILANQGETFQDFLAKVGKSKEQLQFVPDEDNIVPLLEEEWFYDDIVTRVKDFVKAVWGKASYSENIAYIENTLGKDLRKYLVKDFYKDHIKRYKKRPIYWQFSSPKGAFNVLIYMHRYTKDTLSEILNGYLREFIGKLENHIKHLETVVVTGSAAEQAKARKEIDKLKNQIDECRAYEVELYKLAADRIEIDLDEGVLVNYNKFGNVIAPVAGLNDKKAKDKVKKFDWIDTTQIR
ncbi:MULTISPECIES: BREX-1 system adenine-specific DNA-methyltransferase PglX [Empedobacter]|uniref:BREX-1 system adenine-specific DNA-methyltransferase PglX n=1 Tax=Empedobacter TaxID=59734 RepID=UPI0023F0CEEE|nr:MULTISPECIES: BREX-1 system adenine-specific DNA-methyltransferase PglX [Empedobacter]